MPDRKRLEFEKNFSGEFLDGNMVHPRFAFAPEPDVDPGLSRQLGRSFEFHRHPVPRAGSGNGREGAHTVVFPDHSGSNSQPQSCLHIFGADKEGEHIFLVRLQILCFLEQTDLSAGALHVQTAATGDEDFLVQFHRLILRRLFLGTPDDPRSQHMTALDGVFSEITVTDNGGRALGKFQSAVAFHLMKRTPGSGTPVIVSFSESVAGAHTVEDTVTGKVHRESFFVVISQDLLGNGELSKPSGCVFPGGNFHPLDRTQPAVVVDTEFIVSGEKIAIAVRHELHIVPAVARGVDKNFHLRIPEEFPAPGGGVIRLDFVFKGLFTIETEDKGVFGLFGRHHGIDFVVVDTIGAQIDLFVQAAAPILH